MLRRRALDGHIQAENTDFSGFISGFRATQGDRAPGRVLLIGTGGMVNCTPIGHEKSPGCPLPKELIESRHWIFDAVYVPAVTEFIAAARAAGAQVMSGVSLFVFQGVDAFKFFCEDAGKRKLADEQTDTLFAYYKQKLLKEQGQ